MTQETNNQPPTVQEETFEEKAKRLLTVPEYNMLIKYIEDGKHQLAPETAAKFFGLYLTGNNCGEIHRLNKAFTYESILWSRIKYDWDRVKDEAAQDLMQAVREKVIRAQLETTAFMADLLVAASKKHGDKVKKFIQTGVEEDLGDALNVDSLHSLLKIAEGLQKITGQDKKVESKHTSTLNVNVNGPNGEKLAVTDSDANYIDEQAASDILAVMADAKRRKRSGQSS